MVIENAEAEPTTSAARAMDNFAIVKVWCRGDVDVYYGRLWYSFLMVWIRMEHHQQQLHHHHRHELGDDGDR